MGQAVLYDDDILLWSEQQAELIRRLGAFRRDLPNQLDIENVAQEIEGVGRSELAAVESHIQKILLHLIKLAGEPDAGAARHWVAELFAFHQDLHRHYAPSMRQRIDLEKQWRAARKLAILRAPIGCELEQKVPVGSPFTLEDFVGEEIRGETLAERVRRKPD